MEAAKKPVTDQIKKGEVINALWGDRIIVCNGTDHYVVAPNAPRYYDRPCNCLADDPVE